MYMYDYVDMHTHSSLCGPPSRLFSVCSVELFSSVLSINTLFFHQCYSSSAHLPLFLLSFVNLFPPLSFIIALKQSSLTVVFVNGTVKKKNMAKGGFTARPRAD